MTMISILIKTFIVIAIFIVGLVLGTYIEPKEIKELERKIKIIETLTKEELL